MANNFMIINTVKLYLYKKIRIKANFKEALFWPPVSIREIICYNCII